VRGQGSTAAMYLHRSHEILSASVLNRENSLEVVWIIPCDSNFDNTSVFYTMDILELNFQKPMA
jgi:hypothetical protein